MTNTMTTDWLLRVGDGLNLTRSFQYKIWGINTSFSTGKYFIKNVKPGDRLWFIKNKSGGKIIAVAIYGSQNERVPGITLSNEELGWPRTSNTEIHYTDFYDVCDRNLLTNIQGIQTIRKYSSEGCLVNLPVEYKKIENPENFTIESASDDALIARIKQALKSKKINALILYPSRIH